MGAAVFACAAAAASCFEVDPANPAPALLETDVAVIGTVSVYNSGGRFVLVPEAFLKGPVSAEGIRPQPRAPSDSCLGAVLEDGQRVLLFLDEQDGTFLWPSPGQVFWLENGMATGGGSNAAAPVAERDLVARIRTVTGQYAIPAKDAGEGAGIDWTSTVLPVGGAIIGLFVVGLFLMRIWHRIDPS